MDKINLKNMRNETKRLCNQVKNLTILFEKEKENTNRLFEYKQAYELIVDCLWELQDKESQKATNKLLNKIFILNKIERVEN